MSWSNSYRVYNEGKVPGKDCRIREMNLPDNTADQYPVFQGTALLRRCSLFLFQYCLPGCFKVVAPGGLSQLKGTTKNEERLQSRGPERLITAERYHENKSDASKSWYLYMRNYIYLKIAAFVRFTMDFKSLHAVEKS